MSLLAVLLMMADISNTGYDKPDEVLTISTVEMEQVHETSAHAQPTSPAHLYCAMRSGHKCRKHRAGDSVSL